MPINQATRRTAGVRRLGGMHFMTSISNRTRFALLGGVAMAMALTAQPVFAADAPPTTEFSASKATNIEEVVVTARKKTERLLDVPVAANALSTKALAKYATTDLTSVGNQIPRSASTTPPPAPAPSSPSAGSVRPASMRRSSRKSRSTSTACRSAAAG